MTRCVDDRQEQWPLLRLGAARQSTGAVQCEGAIAIYVLYHSFSKCFMLGWRLQRSSIDRPGGCIVLSSGLHSAVQCASAIKQPRAVCRKCFMFHLDHDRSHTCMYMHTCGVVRSCQRSIGSLCFDFKQTTSHGLLLRVYASQWNWACTAFEHVELEVVFFFYFLSSLALRSELVRSYDRHLPEVLPWLNFTPDPQLVQAERFSFDLHCPVANKRLL